MNSSMRTLLIDTSPKKFLFDFIFLYFSSFFLLKEENVEKKEKKQLKWKQPKLLIAYWNWCVLVCLCVCLQSIELLVRKEDSQIE